MEDNECPICFEPSNKFRVLPCGHAFDEECLKKYLEFKGFTCPYCRTQLDTEADITKFIEKLSLTTSTNFNKIKCISCNADIFVDHIKEHDACILDLSVDAQKYLFKMTEQEMITQATNFKEYCDWANKKRINYIQSVEDFSSDLTCKVLEWKKNYCAAIETYFQKDLDNFKKLNTNVMDYLKAKKSSLSNSSNSSFHNQMLPESARVDFTLRKDKVTNLVQDISGQNQSEILASLLPQVSHLSQAVNEFKDPPKIQVEFSVKSKNKECVAVQLSACSALELTLEETASAMDAWSHPKCISDFGLSSGRIHRAKILPNDTIIACYENPNKLEMYDVKGNLLSVTNLINIPEDMIVWKDNQLFICYQDTSFQLVTYANNYLNVQQVLNAPKIYDSISSFTSGNILGKYAKNKCDVLKIENNKLISVETYNLPLSKVVRVYGYTQHCILYSGSNTSLMPNELNCYNIQTGRETSIFPSSSNLSLGNVKDFTEYDSVLFILDFPCHKVYRVNLLSKTCSVLLTEKDGIRNPFYVDLNELGHLLVCYNSLKSPKIKVFNINQAVAVQS